MLKRTILLEKPCYLNLRNQQFIATFKDSGEVKQAPIEDIGFVIVEDPQINISQRLVVELTEYNVALVFCNNKHLPIGMMLNLNGGYQQGGLFKDQITATQVLKKQLWKQTVKAKIENQSRLLQKINKADIQLSTMAAKVKSGDSQNHEATAARIYWKNLFGDIDINYYQTTDSDNAEQFGEIENNNTTKFRRERYGLSPNNMLNYGYAILRAAVARALIGSGLLPTLGIFHRNRLNAYCLADDIMEPFRPFVDLTVYKMLNKYNDCSELTSPMKMELLKTLTCDTQYNDMCRPLMVGLSVTTASLARCFAGEARQVIYPYLN